MILTVSHKDWAKLHRVSGMWLDACIALTLNPPWHRSSERQNKTCTTNINLERTPLLLSSHNITKVIYNLVSRKMYLGMGLLMQQLSNDPRICVPDFQLSVDPDYSHNSFQLSCSDVLHVCHHFPLLCRSLSSFLPPASLPLSAPPSNCSSLQSKLWALPPEPSLPIYHSISLLSVRLWYSSLGLRPSVALASSPPVSM